MTTSTLSHHGIKETSEKHHSNETMRLLLERGSCRHFSSKKIPEDVISNILDAGVHAASGGNLQPFSIIKITNKQTNISLAEKCGQKFIGDAPVNLLFCIDWHRLKKWAEYETSPFTADNSFRHFWISFQDTIIATQNICTATDALGLGSVYIGTILEFFKDLKPMFDLPSGVFPVVLLCVGYPASKPAIRKKLPQSILIHNEKYQQYSEQDLLNAFNEKYDNMKIDITKERLCELERVCKKVHGNEFAQKCLKKVQDQGYISNVQRYFGLHYSADHMASNNEGYTQIMKEFGLYCFNDYTFK